MKKELRIDKILSHMGVGTRTEIKKMAKQGLITVDGEIVKDAARKINPASSELRADGQIVHYVENIYLMLNKPAGYLSATEDEHDGTVLDLLEPEDRAFAPFPVGRLDKDTEGLLLLTNDGLFAHKITSPKKMVPKTYFARLDREAEETDREAFLAGVELEDGYKTLPAELNIPEQGAKTEILLTIYEGKYHQVKRMFSARGKEVKYLKRISIGGLGLDENLKPGEYRALTEAELKLFY